MPAAVGRIQFFSPRLREGRKGAGRRIKHVIAMNAGYLPQDLMQVLSFDARDNKPVALQDIHSCIFHSFFHWIIYMHAYNSRAWGYREQNLALGLKELPWGPRWKQTKEAHLGVKVGKSWVNTNGQFCG